MGWRMLNTVWVVLLVLLPVAGVAEVTRAVVTVKGMSCPFCAFGVEKKLKLVDGVDEVTVEMKDGTATLVAEEGQSLDIGQIRKAVRASGFTPGPLRITAIGSVVKEQEGLLLDVRNSPQAFHLVNPEPSVEERLRALAETGKAVEISGVAHEHVDDLPSMILETVREVAP